MQYPHSIRTTQLCSPHFTHLANSICGICALMQHICAKPHHPAFLRIIRLAPVLLTPERGSERKRRSLHPAACSECLLRRHHRQRRRGHQAGVVTPAHFVTFRSSLHAIVGVSIIVFGLTLLRFCQIRETTGASIKISDDCMPNSTEKTVLVKGSAPTHMPKN
jgi:hypothetical protein